MLCCCLVTRIDFYRMLSISGDINDGYCKVNTPCDEDIKPKCPSNDNDVDWCKLDEAKCTKENTWTCEVECPDGEVCKLKLIVLTPSIFCFFSLSLLDSSLTLCFATAIIQVTKKTGNVKPPLVHSIA
jgi:hypothetical protein